MRRWAASVRRRWRSLERAVEGPDEEWERLVVLALGVSTVLAAAVTWVAVTWTSTAQDEDRHVIGQTVQFEQVRAGAAIQSAVEYGEAAAYLHDRREAEALAGAALTGDPVVAEAYRRQAESILLEARSRSDLAFDATYLAPQANTFDVDRRRAALEDRGRSTLLDPRPPDLTIVAADDAHDRAEVLSWLVCALLGVTFLLTVARVARGFWRPRLLLASVVLAVGALVAAAVQAV